jgi:tetratricopeptide (TPR) repeat protein
MRPRPHGFILLASFVCLLGSAIAFAHESPTHAIADLTRRLDTAHADVSLRLERAELFRLTGEFDRAEADLDTVFALEPESARARLCRGALELDRGRPSLALPWLDAYAVGHPNDPEVRRLSGRALQRLGRPADALIELDAVVGLQGRVTPDDYLVRAQVQREAGWSNERVLMGLDEGRARLGEPIGLELASIDLELELGTFDRALVRLDRIAPRYERKEVILERRAAILTAAGRTEEARGAYAAALAELASLDPSRRGAPSLMLEKRVREALLALAPREAR